MKMRTIILLLVLGPLFAMGLAHAFHIDWDKAEAELRQVQAER